MTQDQTDTLAATRVASADGPIDGCGMQGAGFEQKNTSSGLRARERKKKEKARKKLCHGGAFSLLFLCFIPCLYLLVVLSLSRASTRTAASARGQQIFRLRLLVTQGLGRLRLKLAVIEPCSLHPLDYHHPHTTSCTHTRSTRHPHPSSARSLISYSRPPVLRSSLDLLCLPYRTTRCSPHLPSP